jgi:hypothetical protein
MEEVRANAGTGPQIPDPTKFPHGIRNVTDYVHSRGLKFGLYTAMARSTCGGKAASCGFEKIDADQYAAWQVDYVKEDGCGSCTTALQDIATMQVLQGHARVVKDHSRVLKRHSMLIKGYSRMRKW